MREFQEQDKLHRDHTGVEAPAWQVEGSLVKLMKGVISYQLKRGSWQSWGPFEQGLSSDDRRLAGLKADAMVPGGPSLQLRKISLVLLMNPLVKSPNLIQLLFCKMGMSPNRGVLCGH